MAQEHMTMQRRAAGPVAAALLLLTIPAANYVTGAAGTLPVGFGLSATAGTYLAGLVFVYRDLVHRALGVWAALGVIAAAAVVSYAVAPPAIATASACAFAVAELADLSVFAPLDARGLFVFAVVASNLVGVIVDTLVFLPLAGFPVDGPAIAGQLLGKTWATVAVLPLLRR